MAGIVKETSRRLVIGNSTKEIQMPTNTLDTALYLGDLNAVKAVNSPTRIAAELNALPTVVKNNASLALIADSYKEGIIYAMNGDNKSIDEIGFARGSQATFEDANGNIQLAGVNMPRLNYRGGVLQGWLIEPSSSNLFTDSGCINGLSGFSVKSTSGVSDSDTLFNLGPLLSKGILLKPESSATYASKAVSLKSGAIYTISVFMKLSDGSKPVRNDVRFRIGFENPNHDENSLVAYGNGVYRLFYTFIGDTSISSCGLIKNTGSSSKSVLFTGLQIEEAEQLTSYIPTTTAVSVRLADKIFSLRPTLNFSKNSIFIKPMEYPSTWLGNGVVDIAVSAKNYMLNTSRFFRDTTVNDHDVAPSNRTVRFDAFVPRPGASISYNLYLINGDKTRTNNLYARVDLRHTTNANPPIYSKWSNKTKSVETEGYASVIFTPIADDLVGFDSFMFMMARSDGKTDNVKYTAQYKEQKAEYGNTSTPWSPAPEDYFKELAGGHFEISYVSPIHIKQLAIISRAMKQEEV